MHDLLFVNATVVDGTGAPARRASLAVRDGRISAIVDGADADPGPARVRIDADGRVLAPGIIDPHTHYDAQITWEGSYEVKFAG